MSKKTTLCLLTFILVMSPFLAARPVAQDFPAVLKIRDRADLVFQITQKRLEQLLPEFMRQTGFDMWIITCNEDNLDPIFKTMIPYENWCPITQIIVFFDRGMEKGIERLNVSRTDTMGLFENVWDAAAWDTRKKESQWDCLGRIVRERDPQRIGINEGEIQWAAGGLTVVLKKRLLEAIGPRYAARLESAEPLATLWAETLLDEEIDLMKQAAAISHAIIAETYSSRVITPGYTTVDDLRFHYWQRVADLGLDLAFYPFFSIRGRQAEDIEKYGKDDKVIRPGDFIHCDVGLKYMRYNSDHQEWAYVLRVGETDVPETFKKIMAQGNRLQDIFCGEFKTGITGNELLANILKKAGFYFPLPDRHHPEYENPSLPVVKEFFPNYNVLKNPEKWQRFLRFRPAQVRELAKDFFPRLKPYASRTTSIFKALASSSMGSCTSPYTVSRCQENRSHS